MNYSINEKTKDNVSETLHEASMIIAAIPEAILDEPMKRQVTIAIHNLKNAQASLDNLQREWQDLESDVQPNRYAKIN